MKLLTKEIEKKLDKAPIRSKDGQGKDAEVICKFFHPYSDFTWYVLEGQRMENNDWQFYGYVDSQYGEYGYFTLSELEGLKYRGLGVERDKWFTPCKLGEVVRAIYY